MNKEIKDVVEMLSNAKEIPKSVIFEALEQAVALATKKCYGNAGTFRVAINQATGDYETFKVYQVADFSVRLSEELAALDEDSLLDVSEAQEKKADAKVGDVIEELVPSIEFRRMRIAAQTAKQVIMQKLRLAKREQIAAEYLTHMNELITGTVKKVNREFIIVEITNNAEGFLKRSDMIPGEMVRINDRIRAVLMEVRADAKGPQMILSRIAPEMLSALMDIEVPEIAQGLLEIKGVARDPGSRAKIAVVAKDARIDPVGACVGMRGSRVQAISSELSGERVDIVLWNENPAQYVINALAPAEVASIVVDDENNSMEIIVLEDKLSQVIGRNGQNVKLASQLTGWKLNIVSQKQADEQSKNEELRLITFFKDILGIEESVAQTLAEEGFTSLEEVAYVPLQELLDIENLTEEIVMQIRKKANDLLLAKAISGDDDGSDDLQSVKGITEEMVKTLNGHGIHSRDDLAELAVPDLLELMDGLSEELAGELIMSARAKWFEEQAK